MPLSDKLKHAEFVKIQCDLRLSESVVVDLPTLLRLRRGIRAAAQYVLPSGKSCVAGANRFSKLLEPAPLSDPVARRQHQKIGPAFVLQYNNRCLGSFQQGDILTLEAIVWGGDVEIVQDFVLVLQALGRVGLRYDAGRFEVAAVRGENSAHQWQPLWEYGLPVNSFMVPVRDGAWWLENYASMDAKIKIEITSPARLLVQGKPLFKSSFVQLFPFVLRRVTSMLYGHCHLDLAIDAPELIKIAGQTEDISNDLRWCDWREIRGAESQQSLGGLSGTVVISGNNLSDLLPYLYLGSLMNLGKNAAYGAGNYTVSAVPILGKD